MSDSLRPHGIWGVGGIWDPPTRLLCPWDFPGKGTGVGCHFLLQGIFLTQGSNLCLLCLLHCRQILYYCPTWEAPMLHLILANRVRSNKWYQWILWLTIFVFVAYSIYLFIYFWNIVIIKYCISFFCTFIRFFFHIDY